MRPLLLTAFLLACIALALPAKEARVTVLATTDLHGHIYPWDYLSGREAQRGLAKIATLIAAERRNAPNALLVDAGDTIQGASMESVWQTYAATGELPAGLQWPGPAPKVDPMVLAMNHLHYDAMALGNHEFNYGLKNLNQARRASQFPWLSANTTGFQPSLIKTVNGVRVGIVGLTTPAIPQWEKPENYAGLKFADPVATARKVVAELRPKVDVVLVVAHAGLERGPDNTENFVRALVAGVPGIDAVVFGHTHQETPESMQNGVLLTQPKNWGISLARIDLTVESTADGHWKLLSKASRTIPVTASVAADPEVLRIAEPYHQVTEKWLQSVVAKSPVEMRAGRSRIEDTPIIDAIQHVQLHYAKADVSFAASFNFAAHIAQGPVTVRDIASLYVYDNELYAIEGTGRMVREALENAARYFLSCSDATCPAPLLNRDFLGFNYDMASGVSYEIDLSRPAGDRIRNLRFRGEPLGDDRKLRIAVNNYRAGGSGGYEMFAKAPVVWRSYDEIRDLMIRYYADHPLPSKADGNWRIEPEAARITLSKEVEALSSRPQTQ